jgi:hypothetical protein
MIYLLEPKKFGKRNILDILLNRTTLAFLISLLTIGFSVCYALFLSSPGSKSEFIIALDMLLGLPVTIPLIAGYGCGEALAFLAIGIEVIQLTIFLRLYIPRIVFSRLKKKV